MGFLFHGDSISTAPIWLCFILQASGVHTQSMTSPLSALRFTKSGVFIEESHT